jgi:hypothetical protein
MKRVVVLVGVLAALAAPSAGAVNDPIVPGDNCAPANAQAVGHPAAANNQTPDFAANPLFSENNPGVSTGAQALAHVGPGCPADG